VSQNSDKPKPQQGRATARKPRILPDGTKVYEFRRQLDSEHPGNGDRKARCQLAQQLEQFADELDREIERILLS
jgi:hypothetical protein